VRHLALAVRDQERSRRFWDEPGYVSMKCVDPDGYIVEAAWEPE
jgi:hypothetical protein